MWKNRYDDDSNNTWYVGGGFHVANPITLQNGIFTAFDLTVPFSGLVLEHSSIVLENMAVKNTSGSSGFGALHIKNSSPRISSSRIETKDVNNDFHGVLVSGSYASFPEIKNSTIISRSGNAVQVETGANFFVNSSKIEATRADKTVLLARANSSIQTWLGQSVTYHNDYNPNSLLGLNQLKGGLYALYGETNAVITAGNGFLSKDNNQFCGSSAVTLRANTGAILYANHNFWPTTGSANLVNNGGTIHYSTGTSRGLSSCGSFAKEISDIPLVAVQMDYEVSIRHKMASLLGSTKAVQQNWLEKELANEILDNPGELEFLYLSAIRIASHVDAETNPFATELKRRHRTNNLSENAIIFLIEFHLYHKNREEADFWLTQLPSKQAKKSGENDVVDRLKVDYERLFSSAANLGLQNSFQHGSDQSTATQLIATYPNPFNPTTQLRVNLNERSKVTISLIDITGRKVQQIFSGQLEAGSHAYMIDGSQLASGMYIVSLSIGSKTVTKRIILAK